MLENITIKIESDLLQVRLVGLVISSVCSYLGMSENDSYQTELAVVEAVNNSIIHAYNEEPGHQVKIEVSIETDRIEFSIRDNGKSMGPIWEKPLIELDHQHKENLPESGRGLFIIHQIMDSVQYHTKPDGTNTLTLTKELGTENVG